MPDPYHTPVLQREVCEALAPAFSAAGGVYLDATLGGGGHARAILERFPVTSAVLLDRDPAALQHARDTLSGPVTLVHRPFSQIAQALEDAGETAASAILADLGVSSRQLDEVGRGFSFRGDAPLDMRMDPTTGRPAAERLAEVDAPELGRILREYGEEPDARRIATAIVQDPPRTTGELARRVEEAMSARARRKLGARIHPATRTFQALRIWVNEELTELDALLVEAPRCLAVGGRLAIITFHSLEDRRVKQRFRTLTTPPPVADRLPIRESERPRPSFRIPDGYRKGLTATEAERTENPRARSARLRVMERCAA